MSDLVSVKKSGKRLGNIIVVIAAAIGSVCLTSCQQSSDSKQLRVGLSADFAPICFIEDGVMKGFDVDLVEEIAARLHCKLQLVDLPFETLIPELVTGKLQVIGGGMSPTPQRAERAIFSQSYLAGDKIIAVMAKDSPWSQTQAWSGAKIAVCLGYTTSDDFVTQKLHLEPLRLNNLMECLLALRAGQVDIVVGPSLCINPMLVKDMDHWLRLNLDDSAGSNALLISKLNPELKQPIDQAIEAMIQDGTITALKVKWGIQ